MLPILHSDQISHNVQLSHTTAKNEVNEVNVIDERKPAAQDFLKPGQDQAPRIDNPPLDEPSSQFLEGLKLRSATTKMYLLLTFSNHSNRAPILLAVMHLAHGITVLVSGL